MPTIDFLQKKLRLSINPGLINKNETDDISLFTKGWINVELTPHELASKISQGIGYCCQLVGSRSAANFLCSEILSVDIDGTRTIDEALADPFVQKHLTLLYTTANHTEVEPRFRMAFALPRPIEHAHEMKAAYRSLILKLSGDPVAVDASRIFYGSKGCQPQTFNRGLDEDTLAELIAQGLNADQSDGVTKRTTTVSQVPIAPDRIVELAKGGSMRFDEIPRGTSVHCPFHYDRNSSAFIVEGQTGILGLRCSTCAQTFWPPNTNFQDDFADFDARVREAEGYFINSKHDLGRFTELLVPEGVTYHPGLGRSHIHRTENDYLTLPEPLPRGVLLIKSPKGTGKTEQLRKILSKTDDSILLIGHRISLIRQTCERLDLKCYLDFNGPIAEKRLGICLDSLGRLTWLESAGGGRHITKENLFQTIVIDESEQVLSHFLSDTIESSTRSDIFERFIVLLRKAKTIIALDADLGWLSFETITKLAQPTSGKDKPTTLYVNERKTASSVQVFQSKTHLISDLKQAVADRKKCFVTANTLRLVTDLNEAIRSEIEGIKSILITSDTTSSDEVKDFIANVVEQAGQYDVILTSPSLGTGVDITFPDNETRIDVVYGFFEASVTTHFDFDQQLWRVRHPGEVKVWVSPRRFAFDTALDVVKREIQQKHLYRSVLSKYDDDMKPVYHTDDPLIDMAALARSQQLKSKNNLKRNFIALKRSNGHTIEFIGRDDTLSLEGSRFSQRGAYIAHEQYRDRLLQAKTLDIDTFEDIESRIEANDEVSQNERADLARTRIERFYRMPISGTIIDIDNKGRFRTKVLNFTNLQLYAQNVRTLREQGIVGSVDDQVFKLKTRFVRDQREIGRVLFELLSKTPIYADGEFKTDVRYSLHDLKPFMDRASAIKGTVENILGTEVYVDPSVAVSQLNALLKTIGLVHIKAGKSKAKELAGGQVVYFYQLAPGALEFMNSVVERRKEVAADAFHKTLIAPEAGDIA